MTAALLVESGKACPFTKRAIKDIARVLRQIRDMTNMCIVVCEQVLSFVLDVADRILVMENGRIVHSATRDGVDEAAIARFLAV
jgi:urea transport system ATP-binding protein